MRIAILDCGAVVVREKEQSWLFGAPEGVKEALDAAGIDVPSVVFTTALRAPGFGKLGQVLRMKEAPLNMNGMTAKPIPHSDGSDYAITAGADRILFSERGSVSAEDVQGYDLAIIKNKHRANKFGSSVITWPWSNAEYSLLDGVLTPQEIQFKVWSSMDDVPDNLKKVDDATLSLDQVNFLARVAKGSGEGGEENWAIAHAQFKKSYKKEGDHWVEKKPVTTEKDMDKMSPDVANYDAKGGEGVKCCATCEYFCKDLSCCKVEGEISPMGICSLWEYSCEDDEDKPMMEANPSSMPMAPMMAYMEETKDADGRSASDFLIVGDPKKITTWHLPVKTDGKPDPALMGAASAALTVGYRGNVYEGEGKQEAVGKLIAMYNDLKKDVPENLQKAHKEFVGDRPTPRIIDILTAALHKAYNDTSDRLYGIGYLSQEERLKIAGSIGEGLDAFRQAIGDEQFAGRAVDKWDADSLWTQNKEETWTRVYKSDKTNEWRWASITSVAAWDRQGELLTTKAMDWAINFAKITSFKGPLRYKHIPGFDGGQCDTQLRVGDFLFESGTFDNTPIGLAMRAKLKNHPEVWQISPGLAFAKGDLINGVYKRAAIFERSMTQRPANPFTIIVQKEDTEVKILTEQELKSVADELGLEFDEAKLMYERAMSAGSGPMGLKEFKEVVYKATGTNGSGFPGGANSTHQNRQDDEGETEMLKEAIETLTEEELKALADMVNNTLKEKKSDTQDNQDMSDTGEEAMMGEMPPKKKTKDAEEMEALKALVTQQSELLQQQTKALGELTKALAQGKDQDALENAVAKLFDSSPRRQAPAFASQRTKSAETLPDDDAVVTRLAAIEQQLKQFNGAAAGPSGIYDMFTSTRLNTKKGGA